MTAGPSPDPLLHLLLSLYLSHADFKQQVLAQLEAFMSDQAHLDTDVATLTTALQAIAGAVVVIAQELATLKAANPGLDFTKTDKAVGDAITAAASVVALEPNQPPA
jgi:hypothetical protein